MELKILVDYDNVHGGDRQRGLSHVVSKIAGLVDPTIITGATRIVFRLYGGWFDAQQQTRTAQVLTTEIQASFPTTINTGSSTVVLDVEFAKALLADPSNPLTHTFRLRGQPPHLACESHPFRHCVSPNSCPLVGLPHFINRASCLTAGCQVIPTDILTKAEQKLVDSMLVADIAHLAYHANERMLVVVSADDDIWPGIATALLAGTAVQRIYPKPGFGIRTRYPIPRSATYLSKSF